MEFCLCVTPAHETALLPCGIHLTSNRMGRITPIFLRASETARDVAQDYCEIEIGNLPPHKITNDMIRNQDYEDLPEWDELVKMC